MFKMVARGAKVEKLASGFHNISGGAVGPQGDFYFVDAYKQRIYSWNSSHRELTTVSDAALAPVNLAVDQSGNLLLVSYSGDGGVYTFNSASNALTLKPEAVTNQTGKDFYLPVLTLPAN